MTFSSKVTSNTNDNDDIEDTSNFCKIEPLYECTRPRTTIRKRRSKPESCLLKNVTEEAAQNLITNYNDSQSTTTTNFLIGSELDNRSTVHLGVDRPERWFEPATEELISQDKAETDGLQGPASSGNEGPNALHGIFVSSFVLSPAVLEEAPFSSSPVQDIPNGAAGAYISNTMTQYHRSKSEIDPKDLIHPDVFYVKRISPQPVPGEKPKTHQCTLCQQKFGKRSMPKDTCIWYIRN